MAMVITVQTPSGESIVAEFSFTDTVKATKEKIALQLGVLPSQLVLLHGEHVLQDAWVLGDACGENPLEAQLTVVTTPTLSGSFLFNSSDDGSEQPAGHNTGADAWAVFKNGAVDILVNESEITSESSYGEDKDPYASGCWLARYSGVIGQMDQSDFSIDVTLCQRRGRYDDEKAVKPNIIMSKLSTDQKDISLELVFAAGGCNDYISSAAGLKWITLRQNEIPEWRLAMLQVAGEVWVPGAKAKAGSKAKSRKCVVS